MCEHNLITVNGRKAKPSKQINTGDVIGIESIKGKQNYRILNIPQGNVRKDDIAEYYREFACESP